MTISAAEIQLGHWPEKVLIYELIDPRDKRVRYVGRSKDPWGRWYQHLRSPQFGKMSEWIRDLKINNLEPFLDFIEWVNVEDASRAEIERIKFRLSQGCDLCNRQCC